MQPQRFADSRASSTTSSSASSSWDPPELVHPSRRPLIDNTGPLNAAARDQSSAQTFDLPGRAHFSPESTRYSRTPSQHEAGQVRMPYSPTPGPSSHGARPDAKPATNIRSPSEGGTKTPGPPDGKKGTASAEPARAGKSKADDPDVKVEPSASDTQLDPVLKKKKPRIRDSVDPVVKVEEPAMQLSQLPKKKKKPRTRDSEGSWYDPIAVD
ncbi:hypothetical protein KCU78_g6145, partial [Aureobasidium melanogenum]